MLHQSLNQDTFLKPNILPINGTTANWNTKDVQIKWVSLFNLMTHLEEEIPTVKMYALNMWQVLRQGSVHSIFMSLMSEIKLHIYIEIQHYLPHRL